MDPWEKKENPSLSFQYDKSNGQLTAHHSAIFFSSVSHYGWKSTGEKYYFPHEFNETELPEVEVSSPRSDQLRDCLKHKSFTVDFHPKWENEEENMGE